MSKIKIFVDSPGDLPLDMAKEAGVTVIPVKLSFDGETYLSDKFDITDEEFYKKIRETGIIPKTTQITPAELEDEFRKALDENDEIIFISISSKGSGIYQNALNVKELLEEETGKKIYVIDGKGFAFGYGYAAYRAGLMAKSGISAKEVVEKTEEIIDNTVSFFTVETLDYLKKGGRITTLSAVIGGMLDIRPVMAVKDGLVGAIGKVKGEKKIFAEFVKIIKQEIEGIEDYKLTLLQSDRPEKIDILEEMLKKENVKIESRKPIGSVIGVHAGPGVYGFTIAKK